ncbi:MAG: hypothetical protein ABJB74_09990 [Gemmatimonas sp.]
MRLGHQILLRFVSSKPTPATGTRVIRVALFVLLTPITVALSTSELFGQSGQPSRQAVKGCVWERASDKTAGYATWVQRCDFGNRKIHLFFKGNALMQQYSDGGASADTLVESFELQSGEAADAGVRRVYLAHTKKADSDRCVLAPYTLGKTPPGSKRYTFVPNAAYEKELKKKQNPNEVPEPPCGDWGIAPDGQQYFQVWPTGKRLLFVRVGQDEALFDEMTMRLLAPPAAAKPRQ